MVKPLPAAAPAPPRRLPGAQRREALLAASLPLFSARGYAGTTTRDLAAAAGVTEPILYRHFASKEDLFLAVVDVAGRRIDDALAATVDGAADARTRFHALATSLEDLLAALQAELRVLNGAASSESSPRIAAAVRRTYERLAKRLTEALGTRGLRRGVPASVAGPFLLEAGLGAALLRPLRVAAVSRPGYGLAVERLLVAALTDVRARR